MGGSGQGLFAFSDDEEFRELDEYKEEGAIVETVRFSCRTESRE